ncbi:MAG TPA: hypothetical protein VIK72_17920 [Clostridiaceae bacterium]
MLNKISLRIKILVAIFLCIIVICIATKEAINNRDNTTLKATTPETIKNTSIKEEPQNTNSDSEATYNIKKAQDLKEKMDEAQAQFYGGNYDNAIKLSDEVLVQDQGYYQAYCIKGIGLIYNKKYQEGMDNLNKGLDIKPDYGYGIYLLGLAFDEYGDYAKAIVYYKKSLTDEEYIWSYYNIGRIYAREAMPTDALYYLNKALILDKDNVIKKTVNEDTIDFQKISGNKEYSDFIK